MQGFGEFIIAILFWDRHTSRSAPLLSYTRHYYTTGECHWVFGTSACMMNTLCYSLGLQPVMDVERLRITYIL
jgi:hypothetical protein